MKKFLKISLVVIACLIVVGLVGTYFLLDHAPVPRESSFTIDMNKVRSLATGDNGVLPVEVRSLVIAEGAFPAWMVVAGGGRDEIPIAFEAYQIVYPDKTVIIDAAADRAGFKAMPTPLKSFSDENYKILQDSLRKASLILITHEHFDHLGGIATSPYLSEFLPRLLLTSEQVNSPLVKEAGFPDGALAGYTPLSYDRYWSAAPGIVLIKAPGHTPGQQIIYVATAGGSEYLFVGDIVWNRENLRRQTNRPLVVSLALKEDLDSARGEIRWMIDNLFNNPKNTITYVVSHEGQQLSEYIRAGVIKDGFK